MQKRALGKGLGALFESTTGGDQTASIIEIETDRIIPNRYQPRKVLDERGLRELTESVRRTGILQPVIVRRGPDGRYELIAGERRWRAAQAAGLEKIPAVVKEATDEEHLALALIENLQREDLNPVDAAQAYKRLGEEFHLKQEEIALRIGKNRSTVANELRLLALPVEIQEEIRGGRLSAGHAKALLALSESPDQIRVARRIIQKGLSVRQTERLVKQLRGISLKRKGPAQQAAGVSMVEDRLRRHFGTSVRIIPKAMGGSLVIEYYGLPDLDRIVELIVSGTR